MLRFDKKQQNSVKQLSFNKKFFKKSGRGQDMGGVCSGKASWGLAWLQSRPRRGFPGGASDEEPACQRRRHKEALVRSLGQEDPLEEGMATHSSILAWRIPWTEEPAGYSPWGRRESGTLTLSLHSFKDSCKKGRWLHFFNPAAANSQQAFLTYLFIISLSPQKVNSTTRAGTFVTFVTAITPLPGTARGPKQVTNTC